MTMRRVLTKIWEFELQTIHVMKLLSRRCSLVVLLLAIHVQNFSKQKSFFSRYSLPQNLSTLSVGYARTSGAATEQKYLQQEVHFKKTSQARGSHEAEMRKRFLGKLNGCWVLLR